MFEEEEEPTSTILSSSPPSLLPPPSSPSLRDRGIRIGILNERSPSSSSSPSPSHSPSSLHKSLDEVLDIEMDDGGQQGGGGDLEDIQFGSQHRSPSSPPSSPSLSRQNSSFGSDLLRDVNPEQGMLFRLFSSMSPSNLRDRFPSEVLPPLPSAAQRVLSLINPGEQRGTLSTFMGVFVQCILGTFGVIIFLRLGWVTGQAGLWHSIALFILAYAVIIISMLSVAAIATNGKMQGGGFYFLISRTLGPEFGGSIGIVFYACSLAATAFYLLGFAEALLTTFESLPSTRWMTYLYCVLALICLTFMNFTSSKFFSRMSFVIFLLLNFCIFFALLGFYVGPEGKVPGFTGPSFTTLSNNLWPAIYANDTYTESTEAEVSGSEEDLEEIPSYSFATLFGILFPAATGVVTGVNMSGDLASPEQSIPRGTFWAIFAAFLTYFTLVFSMLLSVDHTALIEDKYIMLSVSPAAGVISFGIFIAILSSALSSLATGARVLQAIAADKLIPFLRPFAALDSQTHEPRRAIILTSFLAVFLLMIPGLDYIAGVITTFYLMVFLFTNFACFILSTLSAPNFRPLFKYYHWGTALAGAILCIAVMFFVDPAVAGASIAVELVVFFYIHFQSPVVSWGYISQALMFQQIRKYLLMLDVRKLRHVKFWRPQVLHMVANPRSCLQLVHFVNKLQQGGLYITGTVLVGDWKTETIEASSELTNSWLKLIDQTKIEAFPEVVISPSVRMGSQTLLMTSGIGGMKPNTVIVGFYDMYLAPQSGIRVTTDVQEALAGFPELRESSESSLPAEDYVAMLRDVLAFGKHLIIARHFEKLVDPLHPLRQEDVEEDLLISSSPIFERWVPSSLYSSNWFQKLKMFYHNEVNYIDVWPLAHLSSEAAAEDEGTFSLTLLLGYILANSKIWSRLRLRVLSFVEDARDIKPEEERLQSLLQTTRIVADEVKVVALENSVSTLSHYKAKQEELATISEPHILQKVSSLDRTLIVNELLLQHSGTAAAIFIPVPVPSEGSASTFVEHLDALSAGLPPTLMCRGTSSVITTEL